MAYLVVILVGLVPVLGLLFAPRKWLKFVVPLSALPCLYFIFLTRSFANSCQSDGCIGIFFLGAIAAGLGLTTLGAGLVRWAIIAVRNGKAKREEDQEQ